MIRLQVGLLLLFCGSDFLLRSVGGDDAPKIIQPEALAAKQDFDRAMELKRSHNDGDGRHLREIAQLLVAATGVHIPPKEPEVAAVGDSAVPTGGTQAWRRTVRFQKTGALEHLPALRELALAYQRGLGVPRDTEVAAQLMQRASDGGDPTAQADVGFRSALGLEPLPPDLFSFGLPDVPRAVLHYFFAAAGNDSFAQLALGYRHANGLGVPKSCHTAILYYQPAAEHVIALTRNPHSLPVIERTRLSARPTGGKFDSGQDVLHYQWFADLGNVDAQRAVGQILSASGTQRDPVQAARYFQQAADKGDAQAMALLGHLYANGRGVKASNATAIKWFTAAAESNQHSALYGLGYMALTGSGMELDYDQAFRNFTAAADQGNTEAWFHLGVMHLNGWGTPTDPLQAQYFFSMAAKTGHTLGMYNLALIHLAMKPSNCALALGLLKKVVEKGPWAEVLPRATSLFDTGDYDGALLEYLRAAEMGFELGQSNAAWMLSRGYSAASLTAATMPVALYQRAARQGHLPALLAVGDAFWYGRSVHADWSRAGEFYSKAPLSQAFFNRGFMHQHGAGLPQDFHLAKRYYDKALSLQPAAWFPVRIALAGLSLHSFLETPSLKRRLLPSVLLKRLLFSPLQQPEGDSAQQVASSLQLSGGSAAARGVLWALRQLTTATSAAAGATTWTLGLVSGGEMGESILIVALLVLLLLVLRRRRALRALYGPPPGPVERQLSRPLTGDTDAAEPRAPAAVVSPAPESHPSGSDDNAGTSPPLADCNATPSGISVSSRIGADNHVQSESAPGGATILDATQRHVSLTPVQAAAAAAARRWGTGGGGVSHVGSSTALSVGRDADLAGSSTVGGPAALTRTVTNDEAARNINDSDSGSH